MLTKLEFEQMKREAWTSALTGHPSKRWEYANLFLLEDPRSDYAHYQMGITMLKQAAMQGDPYAQGDLAYHLYYGIGIDKDRDKALEWCSKALESGRQPKWVRLYNTIVRPNHNIMLSNAQMGLYRAFIAHDISIVEPRLADDVIFSTVLCYPCQGKMDVMEQLDTHISDKETKAALLPTERYGTVTETHIANNKRPTFHFLYFVRTNEKNKIDRIARQPIVWDKYCFSAGDAPFSWEEIEPCLDNVSPSRLTRGFMFCSECGRLSHELRWINFLSKPDPETGYTYRGQMSVCTECKRQVEFHCKSVARH